ncbi:hypothetical protein FLJC2902T_24380 [Flavobacterium limnosediminis JC2902]|uniref:Fibronectin type-III domain-containing protein n=1 Tax=Flavobacterium limnosediminis JC2902 TaxID=1341181 RepID=V6SJ28_9FLAO|nr:T9SS type A sorting domain-containing protein [Flavobacterium limnosediminis]ESU26469.1 hypothetical protein FLJC2902T_24380 [Flavobacterium limnosediminis JC2902]
MKKITFILLLGLLFFFDGHAQVASYTFAQSNEPYMEITGGTILGTSTTATSFDSQVWTIDDGSIPFNFNFNGTNYTGCKVNSNGYITFGTTLPSAFTSTPISSTTAYSGAVSAWGGDLCGVFVSDLITGETSWEVVGTAPNREFVVQFMNWRPTYSSITTNIPYMNFQIRLVETSNLVKVVYGPTGYVVGSTAASGTRQIGLRGATNTDYNNRLSAVGTLFTASTQGTANNSSQAFNTTAATPGMPTEGLTYIWSPPAPCTGTPTAGSVSPTSQNVCIGSTPANLVATGYSTGASGFTFQWEESNDNGVTDAWAPVVGGTGANSPTYTPAAFSGTAIYYRLNFTCGGSGLSAQTASVMVAGSINPTNQISNVAIPAATVGYSQALVNWTNGNGSRRVVYISNSATFTDPVNGNAPALTANAVYAGSGEQIIYDGTGTSVTVTGLSAATQYYIKAYEYVRCGSGPYDYFFNVTTGTNTGNFTTCSSYTVPATENFTTYVPGCWQEADNGDLTAGPSTFGSSSWLDDGFGNVGTTGSARYNVFTTGANDWIMSPLYVIPVSGYELKFDAAATQYAATTAPTTPWEADDFVEVLVSTGTNNWTVLYTYNNTNVPSNVGSTNIIDLDAYAGQTVRFAFRAVEGAANGSADIDFSIDNFEIRLTPACSNPIGLVANGITDTSATISWTATTGNYQYVLDNVATDPAGSGTTLSGETFNATPLTQNTTYYFHVRTVCAGPIYSPWSTISFTTLATPPVNDNCANAIALTPGGVFGDQDVAGTINAANTTSGITPSCQASFTADVWYSVVVPASGNITIEIQASTSNSMTDSVVAAFSGSCGTLTQIGCDDDGNAGGSNDLMSLLSLTGRTSGEVIYIGVWKYNTTAPTASNGQFVIAAYDASLSTGSFDSTSFKAYPNPVKDILNLTYSSEISSVEVYNMLGQNVMTKTLNVSQGQIDMSNLNAGNYIVKVTSDGLTKTIKVIKE